MSERLRRREGWEGGGEEEEEEGEDGRPGDV